MAITRDVTTNEQEKFVESTTVPGQPVIPVANADGSPLSVSVSASDIQIGAVEIKNATDDTRATVRDLAANDALNVAIVDGSGDHITSFGGGTQYTEGATDTTITGTVAMWEDGSDTVVATSATKPLPVNIISGAGSGGTAAADDADFTAGTTSGTPAQGVYESTPTSVTDGDLGTVGITAGRRLKTSATVDAALPAGTNAIGKLAANSGVDIGDVDITSIAAGDNNIGNVDLASAIPAGTNNIGDVDVASVTLGTYAVDDSAMPATPQTLPVSAEYRLAATTYADGDVTVLQSDENGSLKVTLANQLAGEDLTNNLLKVGGNIAHDSADAGNPVKVGGKAASSEPAAVAAADRVDAYFDTTGHQHVKVDAIAAGTANIGDVDVFSNTAKDGSGTRYQPLVDTDGHLQIDVLSGGGGGTQYTEADTDASITGTAMLWEDTSDTLRAVSAAKPLPVDIQDSTIAVTQSGTWDEVGINDSGNSITVDYATTGSGTATGALRVELPTNGTGVIATVGAVTAISNALPAGTNAIGKLAANTGVDIGDVDVTSVVPGTGATNLGKAEDAAHTTGDVGVMALGVRNTGLSELAGTQGDYTPIATSGIGSVYTTIVSSAGDDITNGSGLLVQESGAAGTSLALIDDVVYVDDADWTADTSKHTLVGGVTQATPSANTDGDVTPLITNALRELRVAVPESDLATAATTHVKKYYTNSGAVTDGIVWSSAAGKRWYVTDIFINVSAAATVTLEDDLTAGDAAIWKAELAANSGWSHHFGTPLFSGEDAADLLVTTTAGNIYITVTGYEI